MASAKACLKLKPRIEKNKQANKPNQKSYLASEDHVVRK